MANIKFNENLWVTYYTDDTEDKGYYIDLVYIGTDKSRTNIYDWLSDSAIAYIDKAIQRDLDYKGAWL